MKKLKGVATIKLTDVNTGDIKTIRSENIVTNKVYDIIRKNVFGYHDNFKSPGEYLCGIALFDSNNEASSENTEMKKIPLAWAGNIENSTDGLQQGSMNYGGTVLTDHSLTLKWDWNTSQGNGYYTSISLTCPYLCNGGTFLNVDGVGKNLISRNNNIYGQIIDDEDWGLIYKIDSDNNILCTVQIIDDHTLRLNKYRKGVYKLPLWNNIAPVDIDIQNDVVNGKRALLIDTVDVTTTNSLYRKNPQDYTWSPRMMDACYYQNGKLIILVMEDASPIINVIEITETNYDNIQTTETTRNWSGIFGGDYGDGFAAQRIDPLRYEQEVLLWNPEPFVYPYFYAKTTSGYILKVNINDITEVTESRTEPRWTRFYHGYMSNEKLFVAPTYDARYTTGSYDKSWIYSIDEDLEVSNAKSIFDIYTYTTGGTKFQPFLFEDFVILKDRYTNPRLFYMSVNPFYLGTINNVTPFTKTAAQVMEITYTITEVES